MLLDKCDEDDLWYSRPEDPLNSDPQEPELVVTKHDFRTDGYNIQMIVNIVDLYLSMTWYVSISDLQMFNICLHIYNTIFNIEFSFRFSAPEYIKTSFSVRTMRASNLGKIMFHLWETFYFYKANIRHLR